MFLLKISEVGTPAKFHECQVEFDRFLDHAEEP